MKKTISINIAGLIFYIEEDGYEKLRSYLNSIQKYFANYEDSKEIISDIEGRIAEKFLQKQKVAEKQAIALDDVEELIKSMGTVADFEAIQEEEDLAGTPPSSTPTPPLQEEAETHKYRYKSGKYEYEYKHDPKTGKSERSYTYDKKPLLRDTKRKLLGGVCAGIAHYFNTDPLLVRLVFLFFFIGFPLSGGILDIEEFTGPFSGIFFLLYFALWVAFPASGTLEEDKNIKKFYRDPDKKVIGGVAAGVAAYFGTDIGVIRFIWVLSVLFFGSGVLLYIVLWIITPKAQTLTEKMEMTGQPITLENIETNVKKALQPDQKEESTLTKLLLFPFRAIAMVFNGLTPLASFGVVILRIFAGLMMLLIGGGALIGLITALFALLGVGSWDVPAWDSDLSPLNFFIGEVSPAAYFFFFLLVGIPFAVIAWVGVSLLSKENKFTTSAWQTFLALFLAGLLGTAIFGTRYARNFSKEGKVEKVQNYPLTTNTLLDVSDTESDSYNNTHLDLEGYDGTEVKIELEFRSQGRTRKDAESNANEMIYNVVQKDSALIFDTDFSVSEKKSRFRGQRLRLNLYMPYGKPFRMTRSFYDEFWGVRHKAQKDYDLDINAEEFRQVRWVMKQDSGLVCLDRPVAIDNDDTDNHEGDYRDTDDISNGIESGLNEAFDESFERRGEYVKQFTVSDFKKVQVAGAFVVRIEQGSTFKVEADGRERDIEKIEVSVKDGQLTIERNHKLQIFGDTKRIGLTITMPTIEKMDLSGANVAKITGFSNLSRLEVDASGASKAWLNVNTQTLDLNAAGASKIELQGTANSLDADLAGACVLDAEAMRIQTADVSAAGVSKARLGSIPNLRTNTSGLSKIDHQ